MLHAEYPLPEHMICPLIHLGRQSTLREGPALPIVADRLVVQRNECS